MSKSVAVIGNAYFDEIYLIDKFPVQDQKIIARDVRVSLGGSACNVSAGLSKLSIDAYLFTILGNDNTAVELLNEIINKQIIVKYVNRIEGDSGRTVILLDNDKSSTKIGYMGVCDDLSRIDNFEVLNKFDHIHFASTSLSTIEKALQYCGDVGTSIDFGAKTLSSSIDDIKKIIAKIDLVMMNRGTFKRLYGFECKDYDSEDIRDIIVTAGEDGIYAIFAKQLYHQTAVETEVVDTTGAGDAVAAAVIKGYIDKISIDKILKWAVIAASHKIRTYGGTNGHITYEMLA